MSPSGAHAAQAFAAGKTQSSPTLSVERPGALKAPEYREIPGPAAKTRALAPDYFAGIFPAA